MINLTTMVLKELYKQTTLSTLGYHLDQITDDVAENREWAGVHYATDSASGRALAHALIHDHDLLESAPVGPRHHRVRNGNRSGGSDASLFEKALKEWI